MTTARKTLIRKRRHQRVRSRVMGSATRPRLSVYRSNRHLHAQLIDDEKGVTLASVSTSAFKKGNKVTQAKEAGLALAKVAKEKKVTKVVFDRGGFKYAGRIQAIAEGAREGGLGF